MSAREPMLVVVPGRPGHAAGVDARTIAAAGLASGLAHVCGGATMVDGSGVRDAAGAVAGSVRVSAEASKARGVVRRMPAVIRPALGDVAAVRADRDMRRRLKGADARAYGAVLQYHHRFQRAGIDFARRHDIPVALRVEALEVREEAAWGVRRPGYGRWVERGGEADLLRRADLVVPVSEELDGALAGLGIPAERRLVVPNGVDVDAFSPGPADEAIRREIGAQGRFVVGWVGGFRPFHGLDMLETFVHALRALRSDAVVCLLGGGPLRGELDRRAAELGRRVVVRGPAAHAEVPAWLRSFDACVLFSDAAAFHYSPLKLAEYMACGRPVVAPAVGDLPGLLHDGVDAMLVPKADARALAQAVTLLQDDPSLAARIGEEARRTAVATWSWDERARVIMDALDERRLSAAPGGRHG
jgi:glycosyltransferase involved in cell wall biosynthesis